MYDATGELGMDKSMRVDWMVSVKPDQSHSLFSALSQGKTSGNELPMARITWGLKREWGVRRTEEESPAEADNEALRAVWQQLRHAGGDLVEKAAPEAKPSGKLSPVKKAIVPPPGRNGKR
jgi:hypothetical protein